MKGITGLLLLGFVLVALALNDDAVDLDINVTADDAEISADRGRSAMMRSANSQSAGLMSAAMYSALNDVGVGCGDVYYLILAEDSSNLAQSAVDALLRSRLPGGLTAENYRGTHGSCAFNSMDPGTVVWFARSSTGSGPLHNWLSDTDVDAPSAVVLSPSSRGWTNYSLRNRQDNSTLTWERRVVRGVEIQGVTYDVFVWELPDSLRYDEGGETRVNFNMGYEAPAPSLVTFVLHRWQ